VKRGALLSLLAAFALILAVLAVTRDVPFAQDAKPAEEAPEDTALAAGPHPTIVLEALDHDFGKLKPGTPLEYRFTFTNKGDADLVISSVKASCGCTTTAYDTTVAPGKAGSVLLAIRKTDTYKGRISKGATVLTNDPEHERLRLTLRAEFAAEE
jgi:hypothetical protein